MDTATAVENGFPEVPFCVLSFLGEWQVLAAVAILSLPAFGLFKAVNPKPGDWQGEALAKLMLVPTASSDKLTKLLA